MEKYSVDSNFVAGLKSSELVTLSNDQIRVTIAEYGLYIVSIETPDRDGKFSPINLNYGRDWSKYLNDDVYLCCIAGRYANRIAYGRMTIDGKECRTTINNGEHCNHGGVNGFNKKLWKHSDSYRDEKSASATFTMRSADGDEGFPGNLDVTVVFTITGNKFSMEYYATTDAPTVVNLTHHVYFNLDDDHSQTIYKHLLCMPSADKFLKVENGGIPVKGEACDVRGTVFDFTSPKALGDVLSQKDGQLTECKGVDHTFLLPGKDNEMRQLGSLYCASSGRRVNISTTQPGAQVYSGNYLPKENNAVAIETQHYPNSPNRPDFPSTLLRPGEKYYSKTEYEFTVEQARTTVRGESPATSGVRSAGGRCERDERGGENERLKKIVESQRAKIRSMEKQQDLEEAILEEFRLEAAEEAFTERRVLFLKAQLLCLERRIERLQRALENSTASRPLLPATVSQQSRKVLEAESVIAAAVAAIREGHAGLVRNGTTEGLDRVCEILRETCYQLLMTWRNDKSEQDAQDFALAPVRPKGCCKECEKEIDKWVKGCSAACNLRVDQMKDEIERSQFPR
ncbi:hypothetical protein FOZ63_031014 [Perkinsus olseni]|uniref:Aldose 1-epimerase n=1 Tax=Perkinsus olseni TaxID=32597 RepID=A0A7J6T027_PEROL|nr:hypothetical protein FOZ62_004925 [Perkinsus olseni]KAF4742635.1 hypothetical protein FOZ63_031014 [Perkinsus olseni]